MTGLLKKALEQVETNRTNQPAALRHIVRYLEAVDGKRTLHEEGYNSTWLDLHHLDRSLEAVETLCHRFGYMPDELNVLLYQLYRQVLALLSPSELESFKQALGGQ